jgi:hypothetical protein
VPKAPERVHIARRPIDISKITGSRTPRILHLPTSAVGPDDEDVDLCRHLWRIAQMNLMPWQDDVLVSAMDLREDGRWAADEVGLVACRQQGKTDMVVARILSGVYVFGEKEITYSAHRDETAASIMERAISIILGSKELSDELLKIDDANGRRGLRFRNGAHVRFKTRSAKTGRGLSGDLLILDESFELPVAMWDDISPTVAARANPQVWLLSTAVDESKHVHGVVLARLRSRAMSEPPEENLLYMEWSAQPGPDPKNPLKGMPNPITSIIAMRQANPSLGTGVDSLVREDFLISKARAAAKGGSRGFATEYLGIGYWPDDPESGVQDLSLLPEEVMQRHVASVAAVRPEWPVCIGVDMDPSRKHLSIGAATLIRDQGTRIHLEVGRHEAPTRDMLRYLIKLVYRWDPVAVVIDGRSGAAAWKSELVKAGIEPEFTTASQLAAAFGALQDDMIHAGPETISFAQDPLLFAAVDSARKRDLAGGWGITQAGTSPVCPWQAVALARWGLIALSDTSAPATGAFEPESKPKPTGEEKRQVSDAVRTDNPAALTKINSMSDVDLFAVRF